VRAQLEPVASAERAESRSGQAAAAAVGVGVLTIAGLFLPGGAPGLDRVAAQLYQGSLGRTAAGASEALIVLAECAFAAYLLSFARAVRRRDEPLAALARAAGFVAVVAGALGGLLVVYVALRGGHGGIRPLGGLLTVAVGFQAFARLALAGFTAAATAAAARSGAIPASLARVGWALGAVLAIGAVVGRVGDAGDVSFALWLPAFALLLDTGLLARGPAEVRPRRLLGSAP